MLEEMRLAGIRTIEQANQFWEQRFTVAPRQSHDAHRRLERGHRLEAILSVREPRVVSNDYTASCKAPARGHPPAPKCVRARGPRVEVERRLAAVTGFASAASICRW